MRIQTLSERTQISKRNIHYYIKEGLLSPKATEENGYYDFSEEDYQRLMLIITFRNDGFSLAVIKAMLQTPASAEYYLRIRLQQIEQEMKRIQCLNSRLHGILEQIPVNPGFSDLYTSVVFSEGCPLPDSNHLYDGMLVNHFLWRTFWGDAPLTEYQQFLWHKICKETDTRDKNCHYAALYDYLRLQNNNKIIVLYQERNQHFNRISKLRKEEIPLYAEEMKQSIKAFLRSPFAVAQWRNHYHDFIRPQIHIFTGRIGIMAEEMSPFYHTYKSNSTAACVLVYEWLNTEAGTSLKQEILETLKGFVDLDSCNHAELESMNTIFKYD